MSTTSEHAAGGGASPSAAFERVAIIGLGLMGGSLGLALRALRDRDDGEPDSQPAESSVAVRVVVGYDTGTGVAQRAVARGALDLACAGLAEAVAGADLIVIATPTLAAEQVMRALGPLEPQFAPAAVLTDLCSVKAPLVKLAPQALQHPERYIAGHPMAGLERAGIEAATADLFRGARWALTPAPGVAPIALARVRALVVALGAEPLALDAEAHDRAVAGVSHLPLALAVALTQALSEADDWPTMARLAAGGYRDATRVAAGDPVMGRDLLLANRAATLARLDAFSAALARLRTTLAAGDATQIEAALRDAQAIRLAWQASR